MQGGLLPTETETGPPMAADAGGSMGQVALLLVHRMREWKAEIRLKRAD